MARKRSAKGPRRRGKTPYVRLLRPQEKWGLGWRTEQLDPDSEEYRRRAIPPEHNVDAYTRQDYCKAESQKIMRRLREIYERGHTRRAGKLVQDARAEWLEDFGKEYPDSLETYRSGTAHLEAWLASPDGKKLKIRTLDDFQRQHLAKFRLYLNKHVHAPSTRNKIRSQTITFLKWCHAQDFLPRFEDADQITMPRWKVRKSLDAPYRPAEVRKIFEAADRLEAHSRDPNNPTQPIEVFPLLMITTLGGIRLSAACALKRDDFRPDTLDEGGNVVGSLDIRPGVDKGNEPREIMLDYTPGLRRYLMQLQARRSREQTLAGVAPRQAERIAERLREFGAEGFLWKRMRSTASSYLSSAPRIFEASAADQSADRLGHTAKTARQYYVSVLRGLSREATTLEAALQIEDIIDRLCGSPSGTVPSMSVASNSAE